MEIIETINEITNHENGYDGFEIRTSMQTIRLMISNGQCCCENWGYFMSEDVVEEFLGARLLEVRIVDTASNSSKLEEEVGWGLDEGDVMFVNLETDRGTLQFVAYNAHNGYYGHEARIESEQLNYETTL